MTYKILIFFNSLWLFFCFHGYNLQGQVSSRLDRDPKAKVTLDLMKKRYESFLSLDISFSLEMEIPNQTRQIQKGQFIRKGIRYKLVLDQQTVLCDGKSLWVILNEEKEIQINDMPDSQDNGDILSPEALFNIYKRKDLSYLVLKEYADKGRSLQQIGFKPVDQMADYSKLELVLDKKSGEIISFKAFAKDGSRYFFRFGAPKINQIFPDTFFQYKKSDFPGYYVEDLRS
ncbi:MAG: outer membrane lipoprotein carrier protein LolA [Bacteroidetes bacterium]|nr:outer membrane lipoprotein carrier protein LolA [Bacteroidota bacterium]